MLEVFEAMMQLVFKMLSSFLNTLIKSFKFLNDNELYVLGSLIITVDIPLDKFLTFIFIKKSI